MTNLTKSTENQNFPGRDFSLYTIISRYFLDLMKIQILPSYQRCLEDIFWFYLYSIRVLSYFCTWQGPKCIRKFMNIVEKIMEGSRAFLILIYESLSSPPGKV